MLGETATTVQAPLGGEGEWRAILRPTVAPGTEGSIVAFSNSPATGERVAIDSVAVVFGSSAPEPTPTPAPTPVESFIRIDVPVDGETTSTQEVVVVGRGAGLPENNVVVQALDASGRVLDTRATTVDADVGGEGEWRVTLYPNVAAGTQGRIVASSTSPANWKVIASDEVVVTFGQFVPPAHITIQEPRTGSVLRTDQPDPRVRLGAECVREQRRRARGDVERRSACRTANYRE